jgi:hypothetical protein
VIGLVIASVTLHLRWCRMQGPRQAFAVVIAPSD